MLSLYDTLVFAYSFCLASRVELRGWRMSWTSLAYREVQAERKSRPRTGSLGTGGWLHGAFLDLFQKVAGDLAGWCHTYSGQMDTLMYSYLQLSMSMSMLMLMSLFVSLSVSLSASLSVSASLSLSVWMSLSVSAYVHGYVHVHVYVYV